MSEYREQDGLGRLHLGLLEQSGAVTAFFTGRIGGVSPRWNGGLNWSYAVGDERANVLTNRSRSVEVPGGPFQAIVMAGLVHGDRVVPVTGAEPVGEDGIALVPDCDALITDQIGVALVATAADCVPVFLFDPVRRAVGMVHAGWRGTVAGIAGKAARAMVDNYQCNPADILGAVGPSIGPCCYEVDEAVAEPLRRHYGAEAAEALLHRAALPGKYMLDLWSANRQNLLATGLQQVGISLECTSCRNDRYFSHRSERGTAGRGAGVIALL